MYEEGIVESTGQGTAVIIINTSESCEECSAKVYCKPKDSEGRKLTAKDPFGVHPGDKVRVSVNGRNLLSASLYLYGLPLIILIAGIAAGMSIFQDNPELYSFLSSIVLLALYFVFLWGFSEKLNQKGKMLPVITNLDRNNPA